MSAVRDILGATLVLAVGVGIAVFLFSAQLGVPPFTVCESHGIQSHEIRYCDVKADRLGAAAVTLAILSVGVLAAILASRRRGDFERTIASR